jgi:hypothetical protein
MTIDELLGRLGYEGSDNYLRQDRGDFNTVVDYGHLFRKAAKPGIGLHGVYALRGGQAATVPVVYVCEATDVGEAHKLAWDQDAVPFLIVNNPETDSVHVRPGFCYEAGQSDSKSIREVQEAFGSADLQYIIDSLGAESVDNGMIWRRWGKHVRTEHRIDQRLLRNLQKLDEWLQREGGLTPADSHALIGKYVYLHYLSDRHILSPRKLEKWKIPHAAVFGRDANRDGLKRVQSELDDWLNGEVFPIDFKGGKANLDRCITRVAATFAGDELTDDKQWQLHLDFKAYDFSYVPIEVLSNIYEQFLHAPPKGGGQSKARATGAYYTPIPVVNMMLSELEERLHLERGMRVFDPACGSGAFLVQAFRRLIEREYPPSKVKHHSPDKLRKLVEEHFFGLDTDPDACNVARLSLILTLLDYVDPPDLEDARLKPKLLPDLRRNVIEGNFFEDDHEWRTLFSNKKADWIVGNPPWKQLKEGRKHKITKDDKLVLAWIKTEEKKKIKPRPVGNYQAARAFAWRAAEYISETGEMAMFLPAMSLFEDAAANFRRRFFEAMDVHTVANFSNLRHVLAPGRFEAPAAAIFYRPRDQGKELTGDEYIRTYSPLLANQEAISPDEHGQQNESWNIVVNASEIRDIPMTEVCGGDALPWKVAAWGSKLDLKFIRSIRNRFKTTIGKMEYDGVLVLSQGLELRPSSASKKNTDPIKLPTGAEKVDFTMLKGVSDFFDLPPSVLVPVPKNMTRVRKGRGDLPLSVCEHPHVLVSEGRTFAVYSDKFLVIPHPQIGIFSPTKNEDLLKALALYLSSDFLYYYEFLASTKLGVERDVSTLDSLRSVPMPLAGMAESELKVWAKLHDELAERTREAWREMQPKTLFQDGEEPLRPPKGPVVSGEWIKKLNNLVDDALGLRLWEKSLIHDLVHVRATLNDGRLEKDAVDPPKKSEIEVYAKELQEMLNAFIQDEIPGGHDVEILYELGQHHAGVGLVRVRLDKRALGHGELTVKAAALKRPDKAMRQWVYFDRGHYVYAGKDTYLLKPLQKFHWTKSQAMIDAGEMIAGSMKRGRRT